MLLASALTCAFLLTGLSAWQVIGQLTIWQAASSAPALKVILVGVCISVPAIVGYSVFSYRVFRGKTGELRYA
jgi:cytochrome d ubiquinol oxidase subunit II